MKTLKNTFVLILFLNLIVSCTVDNINEEEDPATIENIQATGEDQSHADQTEKG